MKKYWREGEPFVWATGVALGMTLLIAATLILVVLVNGLGVFWPSDVAMARLHSGQTVIGEIIKREPTASGEGERIQFKIGNRDLYGLDFRWIDEADIAAMDYPDEITVIEREEYGNFYGTLVRVQTPAGEHTQAPLTEPLEKMLAQVEELEKPLVKSAEDLGRLNREMEKLRRQELKLAYQGVDDADSRLVELQQQQAVLREDFEQIVSQQGKKAAELTRYQVVVADAGGQEKEIEGSHIVRFYQPNALSWGDKSLIYAGKLWELIFGEPRESNTEGGLFPAIFGTVMLIFLMTLVTFPLGVIAAVYLREYAKDGVVVRLVRIAVNNLAGIPSIVYGIFGLGFFVYGIGSTIDKIFFPEQLPTPTFGTGGILWASLTLALLTVPVVIVSTEEALGAIPAGVREGSLSLGATKFQTLMRTLLPMASPGIMTGLILAMARAAGEVAPLMITGVVKLAPALPLDGNFPYIHLDRKFMHLGFHIYDIGFQSPNVEAAKPMVFVTTLLLVLIVLIMSSVAIYLRNKMKKRYTYSTF
ncbi:phosphate ABC transporter permease PstA [Desulfuromonas sp. KJ2020]|uniref:phosphate ABC transporter permease PstA n=1 Tax=Desulfuromonas sp. KJ2020 TaxID=2919173 RepID=UPI0020A7251E|nr:phosphate ABC transporter permease PstA [Desulfuromonas sp. KJ2020]MCP3175785.1 phosphate ABC transporter permease PstA [Desulfuromonas sp. KJ2020]